MIGGGEIHRILSGHQRVLRQSPAQFDTSIKAGDILQIVVHDYDCFHDSTAAQRRGDKDTLLVEKAICRAMVTHVGYTPDALTVLVSISTSDVTHRLIVDPRELDLIRLGEQKYILQPLDCRDYYSVGDRILLCDGSDDQEDVELCVVSLDHCLSLKHKIITVEPVADNG